MVGHRIFRQMNAAFYMKRATMSKQKTCEWKYKHNGWIGTWYATGCSGERVMPGLRTGEEPIENKYKFCPFCGGKIVEVDDE